jgi:hypothetical protein
MYWPALSDDQQFTQFLAFNVARAKEGVSMELLLIVLVILLLFGGIGTWPSFGYHQYGYGPSGLPNLAKFSVTYMAC